MQQEKLKFVKNRRTQKSYRMGEINIYKRSQSFYRINVMKFREIKKSYRMRKINVTKECVKLKFVLNESNRSPQRMGEIKLCIGLQREKLQFLLNART